MTPVASATALKVGLFVQLEAKPGKAEEVLAFLQQGLEMANKRPPRRSGSRCVSARRRSRSSIHSATRADGKLTSRGPSPKR